jgi:hypothetical protein
LEYNEGDVVLARSMSGPAIPHTHVRLKTRIEVPRVGNWDGYAGWMAEVMYEEEAKILRKEWSIPLEAGDTTFVYDDCIIGKEL